MKEIKKAADHKTIATSAKYATCLLNIIKALSIALPGTLNHAHHSESTNSHQNSHWAKLASPKKRGNIYVNS
ncbi:MAG: hypothetical protein ACLPXT_11800 [Terracidiphilus sp.]